MSQYFSTCQSLEEAKSLYKKLARQHHPDFGGDTRTMQDINAQYARFQSEYVYRGERTRQAQAHAEGKKTAADYHDLDQVIETLRVKIEAILNMGLEAELCGLWIWVSGDTRPLKDAIKELGFKWASDKKLWYYPAVPTFNRTRRTMEEIRSMHGSRVFSHANQQKSSVCFQAFDDFSDADPGL
jgi:hypothetical protein